MCQISGRIHSDSQDGGERVVALDAATIAVLCERQRRQHALVAADERVLAEVDIVRNCGILIQCPELAFDIELDEQTMTSVEQRFTPLAVPALPHWSTASLDLPEVRWFAGHDVLLRDEARTWPWVRTRNHRALDSARQALSM